MANPIAYYTYHYQRKSDGTPYYYGKGHGNRAFDKTNHRVPIPPRARIVFQIWASEKEALEMEKWWIKFWGRKDIPKGIFTSNGVGHGILRNRTDGGENTPNWTGIKRGPQSAEHRAKLSQSHIGVSTSGNGGGGGFGNGWQRGKPNYKLRKYTTDEERRVAKNRQNRESKVRRKQESGQ